MEWIRWPSDNTNPHSDMALLEKVMQRNEAGEKKEEEEEALDVAMALVDQSELYRRLKMKTLYPELLEVAEEEGNDKMHNEMDAGEFVNGVTIGDTAGKC